MDSRIEAVTRERSKGSDQEEGKASSRMTVIKKKERLLTV